jgi:hypothetical protein
MEIAKLLVLRRVIGVAIRIGQCRLLRLPAQVPYLVCQRGVLRQNKGGKKTNTRKASEHPAISIC